MIKDTDKISSAESRMLAEKITEANSVLSIEINGEHYIYSPQTHTVFAFKQEQTQTFALLHLNPILIEKFNAARLTPLREEEENNNRRKLEVALKDPNLETLKYPLETIARHILHNNPEIQTSLFKSLTPAEYQHHFNIVNYKGKPIGVHLSHYSETLINDPDITELNRENMKQLGQIVQQRTIAQISTN
jgi:hypothetical protein